MTSETTRMTEAELLAEVDRLRAEVARLKSQLANAVPKSLLTREQLLEAAVRKHLVNVPVVKS